MNNYTYKATVLRVIDGDTIDAVCRLPFFLTATHRFRLLGINAPERGKPGADEATGWLERKLLGKEIVIASAKDDSFGRWLATIWMAGEDTLIFEESVNYDMVNNGFALPYTRR